MDTPPGRSRTVLRNCNLFNGIDDQTVAGADVVFSGSTISAVSTSPVAQQQGDTVIDAGGRFLMPGMSDAHVHLMGNANSYMDFIMGPTGGLYVNTLAEAKSMLHRGFTTVRDMGGDLASVKTAIDRGQFEGPRIFPSQAMISQTSGHADFAFVYQTPQAFGGGPSRTEEIGFTRVADGAAKVLTAVREQLRKGATQIKLTVGGGAASMYDPLNTLQYTTDEIRAAVEAAADYGTYVATHVYTVEGIRRAIDAGVRSIEHGHLADEDTVALIAEKGIWLSMQPFAEHDHSYPDPGRSAKNVQICNGTDAVYGWARKHGVKTAWGTDLLLEPASAPKQSEMAARLGEFYTNVDALKMLTSGNAELFAMAGPRNPYAAHQLGTIAEGSWADMLLFDGDPIADLSIIGKPDERLKVIVKNGVVVKNEL
ncbi:metal-dependent hydrolase family protein [Gordonia sp. MP11Mi]|uniref:metal-dependent hydrolase family protein n=1 Tax=Gordonia sp. MP11Mi TaxID=3022769 RepID=UPI003B21B2DF